MDVEIAVRVRRIRDVSVANSGIESALVVERLVGLGDLGKFFEFLSVPRPRDVLLKPQPRVFVRNNRRAGLAQPLVGTSLLGMPVRVEDRMNSAAAGQCSEAEARPGRIRSRTLGMAEMGERPETAEFNMSFRSAPKPAIKGAPRPKSLELRPAPRIRCHRACRSLK